MKKKWTYLCYCLKVFIFADDHFNNLGIPYTIYFKLFIYLIYCLFFFGIPYTGFKYTLNVYTFDLQCPRWAMLVKIILFVFIYIFWICNLCDFNCSLSEYMFCDIISRQSVKCFKIFFCCINIFWWSLVVILRQFDISIFHYIVLCVVLFSKYYFFNILNLFCSQKSLFYSFSYVYVFELTLYVIVY